MKIPQSIRKDIPTELKAYHNALTFAKRQLAELEKKPTIDSLSLLRAQEAEAQRIADLLFQIHQRLTSSEFQAAIEQLSASQSQAVPSFRGYMTPEEIERKFKRPHSDKAEMKAIRQIEREVEALLATEKILSERLCSRLRDIQDKIELRLTENARMLKTEQKEKQRATEQARKREEAEWQQAQKNAAW